ncbi:MAG: DoxX family membrane protein [Rhodoglobus sp.]
MDLTGRSRPAVDWSAMRRWITLGLRLLLGLALASSGLLKLIRPEFTFVEDPTLTAFIDSGWLWQLIGGAEIIGGVALVVGRFVPLGLAVLAPVTTGILVFNLVTGGRGLVAGLVIAAVHLFLVWHYREDFRSLLRARSVP